jgi:hypothetical protein
MNSTHLDVCFGVFFLFRPVCGGPILAVRIGQLPMNRVLRSEATDIVTSRAYRHPAGAADPL